MVKDSFKLDSRFTTLIGIFSLIGVLTGIVYTIYQTLLIGNVTDPFFIGLLSANNFIIWRGASYFRESLVKELNDKADSSNVKDFSKIINYSKSITNIWKGIIFGLVFGTIFLMAPFLYKIIWPDYFHLKIVLALFLFFSNISCGLGLFMLWNIINLMRKMAENIQITIWKYSPLAHLIMDLGRKMALSVAIISLFAILSIHFSQFKGHVISTIAFSAWSLLISSATYVLPLVPLSRKRRKHKNSVLFYLSSKLDNRYQQIKSVLDSTGKDINDEVSDFFKLLELRKQIIKMRVFPPDGSQPVQTAAWVGFLTFMPSIIEATVKILDFISKYLSH